MRKVVISPNIREFNPGFTSKSIRSKDIKSMSAESWAFMFHRPYKLDWKEALEKGKQRALECSHYHMPELD